MHSGASRAVQAPPWRTDSTGGERMSEQPILDPSRDFLAVGAVAEELHVTDRFVRRLIADGELPAVRVGSRIVRVRRSDLERVLHPVTAAALRSTTG